MGFAGAPATQSQLAGWPLAAHGPRSMPAPVEFLTAANWLAERHSTTQLQRPQHRQTGCSPRRPASFVDDCRGPAAAHVTARRVVAADPATHWPFAGPFDSAARLRANPIEPTQAQSVAAGPANLAPASVAASVDVTDLRPATPAHRHVAGAVR